MHGESMKELAHQLCVERANLLSGKIDLPDQKRASRNIKSGTHQCVVHRKQTRAIAHDTALVADRLSNGLTQSDANVLDGVMVVDMQIALAANCHVDQGVPGQLVKHVVKEPHAGSHVILSGAIEIDRHGNCGLGGFTDQFSTAHQLGSSRAPLTVSISQAQAKAKPLALDHNFAQYDPMRAELSIVIPTFNERQNVRPLLALLDAALPDIRWEAVFVDDNSPDGTYEEVGAVALDDDRVRLIHRLDRRGLAGACIEGILSSTSELVAVMDADLQHDETKLAEMVARFRAAPELDLVIGSRHVEGGSIGNGFSALRAWGSELATNLTKRMLRIKASDPMSGFFMIRRRSFNLVEGKLQTQGFKILADMLAAAKGRWSIDEVGYIFRDRKHGDSKLNAAVTAEFLALLVARLTGGVLPIRMILFLMVGASGVIVQLVVLRLALSAGTQSFALAQSLGVLAAMTTNFFLNNVLTYQDRSLRGTKMIVGLLSFYVACSIGTIANIGVAHAVFEAIPHAEFASLTGAVIAALWNFVATALITWRSK